MNDLLFTHGAKPVSKDDMRLCGLLCVVLFLTGCSAERSDGPKDTAQLVQRLKSAIEDADVKELGVLYETPPVRLDDGADLFKEMCQFWAENEYKIYETELYPSLNAEGIPIKFDAEGYIFIVAQDGPPGKIGTTTLTSDFYCKQINGNVYLLNPATTSEIAVNEQTSIRFLLVPKGSTEEVLKQLGSKSDTTFENAWDGITFTSYSMGDLADFISSEVGFPVEDHTGIEGDYSFAIRMNKMNFPSQVRIDLWQMGLDLVLVEDEE